MPGRKYPEGSAGAEYHKACGKSGNRYLTHMLVFEVVVHFLGRMWPGLPPAKGHFAVMALRFCISAPLTLGLMYLSRRYFEQPFLDLKDRTGIQNTLPIPLTECSQPETQMQSA